MKKMKKVVKHLKGDMKMFSKEKKEDKELLHEIKESKGHEAKEKRSSKKPKDNMEKVMSSFKKARLKARSEMPKKKK